MEDPAPFQETHQLSTSPWRCGAFFSDHNMWFLSVLFLAGIVLIFSLALRCYILDLWPNVLIIHWYFSYCWAVLTHCESVSHFTASTIARCTRRWKVTQWGQLSPSDWKGIPYCVMSCSSINLRERRTGGHLELWHLSSQVMCDEALLSWR